MNIIEYAKSRKLPPGFDFITQRSTVSKVATVVANPVEKVDTFLTDENGNILTDENGNLLTI